MARWLLPQLGLLGQEEYEEVILILDLESDISYFSIKKGRILVVSSLFLNPHINSGTIFITSDIVLI